jgi:hydroxyethylthiazole kinase-like uncharacterized protein yjeF
MEKYEPNKNQLVMTRDEVRSFDAWAINKLGIPGVVLMENAGRSCAELIKEKLASIEEPKVCIFCGTGNNGGDGYVIARHLLNAGFEVTVVLCGDVGKVKGDAKTNLDILQKIDKPIEQLDLERADIEQAVKDFAAGKDFLVDALFGTGLQGLLNEKYQRLINAVNDLGLPVLAVDIPSGLDCDTGKSLGAAVRAAYTVTFVAVKAGFTNTDALKYTGRIFIASIGVEPSSRKNS